MEEKVSKKAQKVFVAFLLLMLLCTGISRGMASLTTPKVEVATVSSQDLANTTMDYGKVEKVKGKKLGIVITLPADEEVLAKDDTIDIYNLSTFALEQVRVEKTTKKDNMISTVIPLSSENYKEGEMVGYTVNHVFGSYHTCVPLKALRSRDNHTYLLVLEERETVLGSEYVAKEVEVDVTKQDKQYANVQSDELTDEDQVIIDGNKNVEKGDVVRLAKEE